MIQRILIVAAFSIGSILLWAFDIVRPWVIEPFPVHVARGAFALLLLSAGVLVVLRSPSKAAWGFFAFALFGSGAPAIAYALGLPAAGLAGALVFALYATTDEVRGWRRMLETSACVTAAAVIALGILSTEYAFYGGTWPQWLPAASLALQTAAILAVPLILLETCLRTKGEVRERLRWVIAGFAVNACLFPLILAADQAQLSAAPRWGVALLAGLNAAAVASTVPYALLKQPIVDVSVVLCKVLAYAIFAVIAAAAVTYVHLPLASDVALAVAFGFFVASTRTRVEGAVKRIVLRERHRAEQHLQMVVHAMPLVDSRDKVDRLTIEEPVHSLNLSGGTLFWCRGDAALSPRHEFGIDPPALTDNSHESALATYLQNEKHALRLNQHGWNIVALAVPVFSHGALIAVALYGLHRNGTDVDAEEIAIFEALAAAAGDAYDRIEVSSLREQVRELQDVIYDRSTLSS